MDRSDESKLDADCAIPRPEPGLLVRVILSLSAPPSESADLRDMESDAVLATPLCMGAEPGRPMLRGFPLPSTEEAAERIEEVSSEEELSKILSANSMTPREFELLDSWRALG